MTNEKPEIPNKARFDTIDKLLTMFTVIYFIVLLLPYIAAIFSKDNTLVAILSEVQPDAQFFNIWLILVGTLTGKQIQKSM